MEQKVNAIQGVIAEIYIKMNKSIDDKNITKPQLVYYRVLGDGWRDVRKELPVTPFLAYWTDGRMTVLEEGDSVSYALTGDKEKRIIAWIPLSEIGKPTFA